MLRTLLITLLLLPQNPYDHARPERILSFPADHGNHPSFKTEWWYFTGHFVSNKGRRFGFEVTFFRVALDDVPENPSSWRPAQLFPAHFAVTDLDKERFHYQETISREGPGIAGSRTGKLDVWVQNWYAKMQGETIEVRAAVPEMKLKITVRGEKPPVLHGEAGYSRKGPEPRQASHYYSLTRLIGTGTLELEGQVYEGEVSAWMDHEFMTNLLSEDQVGWDWFSLQLENGEDLMLFQIRGRDGASSAHSSGTWVSPSGETVPLSDEEFQMKPLEFWTSPNTSARYPIAWQIQIPARELMLEVRASIPDQELVTIRSTGVAYWEGAVQIQGRQGNHPVRGRGYLEMTGYSGSRPNI